MPLYESSYSTTIGSLFNTKAVEIAIQKNIIEHGIVDLDIIPINGVKSHFITGYGNTDGSVPLFAHPIILKDSKGEDVICSDMRYFINPSKGYIDQPNIKNITEYNFALSKHMLNALWLGDKLDIKANFKFSELIFTMWLSGAISKAYALDYGDQFKLNIVTSFYYQSLFEDKVKFDERDKQRFAVYTIKSTGNDSKIVFDIFDKIDVIAGIGDYCSNVIKVLDNVRLDTLTPAAVATLVRGSWYGNNSKEIIGISLEHPPTWISMLYTSLVEKTYKNSSIYKLAEKFGKRGNAEAFLKNYTQMTKSLTKVKDAPYYLIAGNEGYHELKDEKEEKKVIQLSKEEKEEINREVLRFTDVEHKKSAFIAKIKEHIKSEPKSELFGIFKKSESELYWDWMFENFVIYKQPCDSSNIILQLIWKEHHIDVNPAYAFTIWVLHGAKYKGNITRINKFRMVNCGKLLYHDHDNVLKKLPKNSMLFSDPDETIIDGKPGILYWDEDECTVNYKQGSKIFPIHNDMDNLLYIIKEFILDFGR
jgi:hypothetical protein